MTEAELMQLLAAITPPDETARAAARCQSVCIFALFVVS